MSNILKGKVALVTGGSRGLGAAIAEALADQGADVAISYVASAKKAQAVVEKLKAKGVRALAFQSDQADTAVGQTAGRQFGGALRQARHPRQQRCDRRAGQDRRRSRSRHGQSRSPVADQRHGCSGNHARGSAGAVGWRPDHLHRLRPRQPCPVPGRADSPVEMNGLARRAFDDAFCLEVELDSFQPPSSRLALRKQDARKMGQKRLFRFGQLQPRRLARQGGQQARRASLRISRDRRDRSVPAC